MISVLVFHVSQTDASCRLSPLASPFPVLLNGALQVLRSFAAGPAALEIDPYPELLSIASVEDVILVTEVKNPIRSMSVCDFGKDYN